MPISSLALDKTKWLQYNIFLKLSEHPLFREMLECYHDSVRLFRRAIDNDERVIALFFTHYGPQEYEKSPETMYERKLIEYPKGKVVYIRLRLHVQEANRASVKDTLSALIDSERRLILDHEILKEYDATKDLGQRYATNHDGTIDNDRTIRFIRYWDSTLFSGNYFAGW